MVPKILALDVEFDMSPENFEKIFKLKLELNKNKFDELNNNRKKEGQEEITLKQVENLVLKGNVKKEEDSFIFEINPDKKDEELNSLIKPILELDMSFFEKKKTVYLHLAPNFNELMKNNKFDKILNEYFLNLRKLSMKKDLDEKDFKEIQDENNKFYAIYKSLLNQPLKQIKDVLLPTLEKAEESQFYNEIDDDFYKYNIYLPEDYFWELPKNMKDEIVKIDNLKLVLRYLNLEEFNDDKKYALDDEYTKNIGKVIYQETLELDKENPFEKDWSTEFIKQNNSIVETHTFPKFYKENDEIKLSNPGKSSFDRSNALWYSFTS